MKCTPKTVDELKKDILFYKTGAENSPVSPFVLAVTGHRSFARPGQALNIPGYTDEQIKSAFQIQLKALALKWQADCGSTAPLIFLSGMADGADQITVESALESDPALNIKVFAVLPMERTVFRKTVDNQSRFDRLLEQVDSIYVLPPVSENKGFETELADVGNPLFTPRRQKQYEALGLFLTSQCHLLFAFWDGIDMPNPPGGTSSVVRVMLERTEGEFKGLTAHFLTPRNNKENGVEPVSSTLDCAEIPVFLWTQKKLEKLENGGVVLPNRSIMTQSRRCSIPLAETAEVKQMMEALNPQ